MEARKKKPSGIQLGIRGNGEGHERHIYYMYLGSCVCCQVAKSPRGNEEWSRLSQPIVSYVGLANFLSGLNRRCPSQGGGRTPGTMHLSFVICHLSPRFRLAFGESLKFILSATADLSPGIFILFYMHT